MTTTKNPWNQLSNVDINGEQAILATEDVELIKNTPLQNTTKI